MAIIKQYHKDTDTTYVYESISYWDPEKKQSRSKRRVIGKLDPVTGEIIPTGKRGRPRKQKQKRKKRRIISFYRQIRSCKIPFGNSKLPSALYSSRSPICRKRTSICERLSRKRTVCPLNPVNSLRKYSNLNQQQSNNPFMTQP